MSNEKLRRETSGFDITFKVNKETNQIELEKQLPKNLRPEDFIGHLCVLKVADGKQTSIGTNYDYHYAVISDCEKYTTLYSTFGSYEYVILRINFTSYSIGNAYLRLVCDYRPNDDEPLAAKKIKMLYIPEGQLGYSAGAYSCDKIMLDKTVDNGTGDVTYSGSGYICAAGTAVLPWLNPMISMATKEKVGSSNSKYSCSSRITSVSIEQLTSSTSNVIIHIDRYLKWLPTEVTNASIVIATSGGEPSNEYYGVKKYPITITFTVPAANL